MKIYHHIDADGYFSAHTVNTYAVPDEHPKEFIGVDYGTKINFSAIKKDELVYIVDFSFEIEDMNKLLEITQNVVWIDHHITSISKYNDFPVQIKGLRIDGIAACELCYIYLVQMTNGGTEYELEFKKEMQNSVPMYIRYVGDRDVWKYEFGDSTVLFNLGLNILDIRPTSEDLNKFVHSESPYELIDKVISAGHAIKNYRDKKDSSYVKSFAFDCKVKGFEQYKVLACNRGYSGSEMFNSITSREDTDYDVLLSFAFDGKEYKCSVYRVNPKTDVSEIALYYEGGGHKGAAGFKCKELPIIPIAKIDYKD